MPLWPQLAEVLGPYLLPADRTPRTGLLFPRRNRAGELVPIEQYDGSLAFLAKRAGLPREECLSHAFRHTWTAARIQTIDHVPPPISKETVKHEGGWSGDTDTFETIYKHIGTVRHRSEVVEYRVGQHEATIRERFGARLVPGRSAEWV